MISAEWHRESKIPMGSTTRSLVVATRVDNSGLKEGFNQAVTEEKAYVEKTNQLNKEIIEARNAYRSAKKSGAFVEDTKKQLDEAMLAQKVNKQTQEAQGRVEDQQFRDFIAQKRDLEDRQFREFLTHEQDKKTVDDEYFRATHTQIENRLRDNQTYYAQLRQMHAANAEMMVAIDRAQAAKEVNIRREEAGGGITGTRQGRRAVAMVGAQVAGDISPELGKGVGTGMMVGMMGATAGVAVAVGGIVVAVSAITEGFKSAKEESKKIRDIQREVTEAIKQSNEELMDKRPTTAMGERQRTAIDTIKKEGESLKKQEAEANEDIKSYHGLHPIEGFTMALGGKTSLDERRTAQEGQLKTDAMLHTLKLQAISSEAEEGRRIKENNDFALQRLQVEGMRAGIAKEQAALQIRQNQELAEARHKQEDNPHGGDLVSPLLARQAQEQANLITKERERANEEMLHDEESVKQAELHLISNSYDREIALLHEKHVEEIRSYDQARKDITNLLRRQAAEEQEIRQKSIDWVKAQREALDNAPRYKLSPEAQAAVKSGAISQQGAADLQQRGYNKPLDDEKKRLDIELALANGQITLIQAEERRLAITDSLADATKRAVIAQEQQDIRNANENKKLDQETRHNELERKRAEGESMYAGHPTDLAKFRKQMEREELQQQLENAGIKADSRKIDAMIASKHATESANENASIDKQIQRDQIEIKLERGKITRLEAEKERLRFTNPEASAAKIDELAKDIISIEDLRRSRTDRGESSTKYSGGQIDFRYLNLGNESYKSGSHGPTYGHSGTMISPFRKNQRGPDDHDPDAWKKANWRKHHPHGTDTDYDEWANHGSTKGPMGQNENSGKEPAGAIGIEGKLDQIHADLQAILHKPGIT